MTAADGSAAAVTVLFNPRAGRRGQDPRRRLTELLRHHGVAARVEAVEPDRLAEAVRDLVRRGVEVVAVCGGDGTLLTAASELAGTRTALLPVPTGTLNHFARRLELDDPDRAVRALVDGRTVRVPVGVVDERIFLNTATFGLYADVVRRRERLRPWLSKWPAAAVALTMRFLQFRQLEITLEVGGRTIRRETPLLWVGVGRGSFPLVHEAPEQRWDAELEIVVMRPGGRAGLLRLLARVPLHLLRRRRPILDPVLEVIHARTLLIRARHSVGVTLDGEVLRLRPPIFVATQQGALRVRVGE